jgi:ribosomal protein L12E/L44/L45/RPP1/RPP2
MSDDEQRVQEAAAEFMRTVPVQDVIVSMVQTVFDVGYRRTGLIEGGDQRDLAQTALAIETVRALMPVLERVLDAASMTTLRSALSELQLAYAQAAEAPAAAAPSAPGEPQAAGPDAPKAPPQEQESRITPERPRIWTPGGDV